MTSEASGRQRAPHWWRVLAAAAVLLLAVTGWAQADPPSTLELATPTQSVVIVVPAAGVVIHLDQVHAASVNGVRVPPGLVSTGNLQIFQGPDRKELTDFSSDPMRIYLQNASKAPVKTFAILRKDAKGAHWVFWNDKGELEAMGFVGEFHPGLNAYLEVRKWPKGDPGLCH